MLITMQPMLRLLRSRPLALLAGLWFLVAGREPPFPHPCEMDRMGSAAAASVTDGSADAHAHHQHAHDAPAPASATTDADGGGHAPDTCECVDDCCVSIVAQAAQPATLASLPLGLRAPQHLEPVAARSIDAAPRLLPFANGPPALT